MPPITAYVLAAVDDDAQAARDAIRAAVGFFLRPEAHTELVGRSVHGAEIRRQVAGLAEGEPLVVRDAWIDEFAAAGDAGQVRTRLREWLARTRLACGSPAHAPGSTTRGDCCPVGCQNSVLGR